MKFITDIFCGECKQADRFAHNGFKDEDNAHTINEKLSENVYCDVIKRESNFIEIFTYDLEEIKNQLNEK